MSENGRSAASAASGHSPKGEASISVESSAKPSVPNADDWNYAMGEQPLLNGDILVWALGRYGDVYGPIPFEMIAPDAWEGNMLHASHDLVAWAECSNGFRQIIPYQPRDPSIYGRRATAASAIEARSDATGTGAAEGESAARQGDAQTQPPNKSEATK